MAIQSKVKFFSDMIEEIDLMNICVQIAQEYWTLGEAFVYAELDQSKGKWKRLLIQNPDYITVKRSAMAGAAPRVGPGQGGCGVGHRLYRAHRRLRPARFLPHHPRQGHPFCHRSQVGKSRTQSRRSIWRW